MSSRIHILPDLVANQIKAGEVVETPSSAVKEMMENAIDAGATEVKVNFKNGGRDLIQIIDNGCGMTAEDAKLAFMRHATSKISSLDDIYALHTFGFRGEALASIAAISQVELLTRQHGEELGSKTILNGGEMHSQTPVSCAEGCQFLVRNIFYNTPARRKFIDNNESKLAAGIKSEFRRVVLCHPEVSFQLLNNSAPLYILPRQNLAERIVGVMGNTYKNNLLEVDVKTTIATLNGYVGRPETSKSRAADQYMFVNGRFFRSPYLNKAVQRAYEKLIPQGNMPSFFLYITVDPQKVDVNVHAKKTEVRFADNDALWQIINAAVRETLAKTGAVPMMDFEMDSAIEIPVAGTPVFTPEPKATTRSGDYNPFRYAESQSRANTDESAFHPTFSREFQAQAGLPEADSSQDFEFIDSAADSHSQELDFIESVTGIANLTIQGRYATLLWGANMIAVDLQRANERLIYDSVINRPAGSNSASQRLLFPQTAELSAKEMEILEESAAQLLEAGFDFDMEQDSRVALTALPASLEPAESVAALHELLDELQTPCDTEHESRSRIALRIAKRASSRTGSYTETEAGAIIRTLMQGEHSHLSPYGRKIYAELSADTIKNIIG